MTALLWMAEVPAEALVACRGSDQAAVDGAARAQKSWMVVWASASPMKMMRAVMRARALLRVGPVGRAFAAIRVRVALAASAPSAGAHGRPASALHRRRRLRARREAHRRGASPRPATTDRGPPRAVRRSCRRAVRSAPAVDPRTARCAGAGLPGRPRARPLCEHLPGRCGHEAAGAGASRFPAAGSRWCSSASAGGCLVARRRPAPAP